MYLPFEGVMNAASNSIRQFAKEQSFVIIRLMEANVTLNKFARTDEQKEAVREHGSDLEPGQEKN